MTSDQLIDALKRLLKQHHVTYAQVARGVGLSEASVKRLFSEKSFTLKRIEQILKVIEVDFFELAKLARGASDAPDMLTAEQEETLAADPRLLGLFYLLYNGLQPKEILRRYELAAADCTQLLVKLDRAGLIDYLPGERVRVKVSRHLQLRPDGAIRRKHGQETMREFLAVRFDEYGGSFRFEFRELTAASFAIMQRRLDRMAAEFNELAELDSTLPAEQRQSIGMAVGIRPWKLELVTGLAPRARQVRMGRVRG
jgi:transcriptional regulator with XRE-family HTH domain